MLDLQLLSWFCLSVVLFGAPARAAIARTGQCVLQRIGYQRV
jgi:hypothetical protein